MENELFVKMALNAWNAQVKFSNKLFDSITDEQMMNEVSPGRNRGVYLLGHLAAVNDHMLPLLDMGVPKFPHLYEIFESKPDRAVAEIPTVAELRKNYESSCAELEKQFAKLSAGEWFQKHTSVSAEDFVKEPHRNKLNVVISRIGHLQYHLGQMALLKSKG